MSTAYNPVYSRRKRFLPEYRQLFEVLLKIPDEDVRERVMNAINGATMCSVCKKKDTREAASQTDNTMSTVNDSLKTSEEPIVNHEDNSKQTFEKKRRKRKRPCPKVVKTAQHSSVTPVLEQHHPVKVNRNVEPAKRNRTEFEDISLETSIDFTASFDCQSAEHIKQIMKVEYETCFQYTDGLLPIHQAITKNDLYKLHRQIFVFKYLKTNLMELLTDDDYNVIQLAVSYNCYKFIIEVLLSQETIHLKDIDDQQNTIIHLAVMHLSYDEETQQTPMLESLELLLKKFDLNMLLEKNDEGMTALHLAVRDGKYLMVETMLKVIDEMLNIKSGVEPIKEKNPSVKAFTKHYNKQCDSFEGREFNKLKSEILNATDMKSGCTALYSAMEKKYDHIIYLLLAHMSDPTIKNLAGIDAKTYYSDYGNNPSIAGTLERVTQLIQKQKNL